MKTILTTLFFAFFLNASATNYYFSSLNGDDTRTPTQAQSTSTPWRSLTKLNSFFSSLSPGDSVLFKRDETFYGSFTATRSGSLSLPIIIGTYGNGARPVFTSLLTLSTWTAKGGNIYESATNSSLLSTVKVVLLDGVIQRIGRYPNADAANGGYLTYQSHRGDTIIIDSNLAAIPNWTGAIWNGRTQNWSTEPQPITSHVGHSLTVTATNQPPSNNYGYFFSNHIRTLDQNGEHFYDPSVKKLSVYLSALPSGHTIQVSSISSIINVSSFNYITFDNIEVRGANDYGALLSNTNTTKFKNCSFKFSGLSAIKASNCSNLYAQNSNIDRTLSTALYIDNCNNTLVSTDTITNTHPFSGMGGPHWVGAGQAIYIKGTSNHVQYCTITATGFQAINYRGDDVWIVNNRIDTFCTNKSDGGGINSFIGFHSKTTNHAHIIGNVISNGIGAPDGSSPTNTSKFRGDGIYLDVNCSGNEVRDNTIFNCYAGTFFHFATNSSFINNNLFNNRFTGIDLHMRNSDTASYTRSMVVKNNKIIAENATQKTIELITDANDLGLLGTIDSNYFATFNTNTTPFRTITSLGTTNRNLTSWRGISNDRNGDTIQINSTTPILETYAVASSVTYTLPGYFYRNVKRTLFNTFVTRTTYTSDVLFRAAILGAPPVVSITSPANGAVYTAPASVTINANATSGTGTIASVKFYNGPTLVNTDNTAPYSYTITGLTAGSYTFTVKATDNSGLISTAIPVTITVGTPPPPPVNKQPVIVITSPSMDSSYLAPASITINASASDTDGTITAVHAYKDNVFAGSDNTSPYSFTSTGVTAGGYTYTLRAIDNSGDSTATFVRVIVADPPPPHYDTLSISVTVGTIGCAGETTTATVSGSGGLPFSDGTYHGDYGDHTVNAGIKTYYIEDSLGVRDTLTFAVPEPGVLSASVNADTIAVYLGTVNKVVTVLGGTSPFLYQLNSGAWQSTNVFTLAVGSYTINVKDAHNCTTSVSFTLTQPPPTCSNCIIHGHGKKIIYR